GAVLASILPIAFGAFDGRWKLADADHAEAMSFVARSSASSASGSPDGQAAAGSFRVLWLGAPEVLPVAGYPLADDLDYALTVDGTGTFPDRLAAPAYGSTALVAEALRAAASGSTDRLGRLLRPFGVRYVAVVERAAPSRTHALRRPLPRGLAASIARQLDLQGTEIDADLTVYANDAWSPVRAVLPDDASAVLDRPTPFAPAAAGDLPNGVGVLQPTSRADRFTGSTPAGEAYAAWSSDDRWHLTVDGRRQPHREALGWANAWSSDAGRATLAYASPPLRLLSVLLQLALWLGSIVLVVRWRRRLVAES
ncbi:MAG: hypothetical protein JF603_15845, partial [Acidobacteria bacterium]|nr:hypothetical protein [Acidobacteriota bacterium]